MPGPVIRREVVSHPFARLAERLGICDRSLLPQFPARGRKRLFIRIDAALRHLPFVAGKDDFRPVIAQTMRDEHAPLPVEERDPDIGSVGKVLRPHGRAAPRSQDREHASVDIEDLAVDVIGGCEARKITAPTNSSGLPQRVAGVRAFTQASNFSSSMRALFMSVII